MALEYDFYISPSTGEALGFNTRITPETPYERATAQFRKEQFDSTPTVGDQSLSGWWTRGQMSFHKGAGVTYYEVGDGEAVFDRYSDSDGVEVFKAGEVSLLKEKFTTGSAATDATPVPLGGGSGCYALTPSGVKYTTTGGETLIPTSDAAVPYAICTDGDLYYVANGNKIERQAASPVLRTNHVTNPNFESYDVGTTGWTDGGGFGAFSVTDDYGRYGRGSSEPGARPRLPMSGSRSNASGDYSWFETTVTGLVPGNTYAAQGWMFNEGGADAALYTMTVAGATVDTATASGWTFLSGNFVAAADTVVLRFIRDGGALYQDTYIDAVLVTEAPYTGSFFDGSFPGCAWLGAPDNSKSKYVTPSADPSTVLWTSTDSTWSDVFYAKGRLFGVDAEGRWYSLPVKGGTTAATDAFWLSGRTGVNWQVTDGPSSVFISDGSSVYSISITTDGLVPTLGVPTTVATVPNGETISSIGYYLGHVVLTTTAGVRAALARDNEVYMGPLIIEGDFSASRRIGCHGNLVYVTGRPEGRGGDNVCCAIDLSRPTPGADLVYAWSPRFLVTDLSSTASGAVVDGGGRVWAWAGSVMVGVEADDRSADGYLITGHHRLGTLDDKHYSTVSLRLKGTGNVDVHRIDADGTETLLSTVAATQALVEIPLGLSAPAERIALRFTLKRDAVDSTRGPTLLGYQLKALPLPKRQRMFRVPLMLFDKEANRNGQTMGTPGSAWDRLAALEALEQSNAVVTFDDKETGETGSAYIESIEVRRSAPAGRQRESFGGLIYLTLRQI